MHWWSDFLHPCPAGQPHLSELPHLFFFHPHSHPSGLSGLGQTHLLLEHTSIPGQPQVLEFPQLFFLVGARLDTGRHRIDNLAQHKRAKNLTKLILP